MAGDLRTLPFPEQLGAIDAAIDGGGGGELIGRLAGFRDHQPLAYALARMAGRGELAAIAGEVATIAIDLPDTGLRRALRALEAVAPPPELVAAIAGAAAGLPLERIAALAMIDRWLKNAGPEIRRAAVAAAVDRCATALDGAADVDLVRLPGEAYAELAAIADEAGAGERWRRRLGRFAAAVLDALEDQPKSLSQANAEELLARQVYTDPGHFLVELLQNADDAGARAWHVRVCDDRVEVEHDGAPFDARDVVGILSIGQTTKSKEQIGFFGVGFKSVYEICERPQIYSGPFAFEIADVSIPRPLAPRPAVNDVAGDRTLLVLPLRDRDDPERSPGRLFERLADLPGEVLLTLNAVREIDARCGDRRRRVTTAAAGNRVRLDDNAGARHFVVETAEARYPGARDASRAESTPILVAVELDESGAPIPIGERPTIYSYLPTGERSGLRFAVHAHFDVPVDRERLDLSSPWNRWAIAGAAPLLAAAVRSLPPGRRAAAVDVVPLPAELGAPAYQAVAADLGDVELFPGAGGGWLPASRALVAADARFAATLGGVDLGGRELLAPIDRRGAEVAAVLGARPLEVGAVVAALAADAAARRSGEPFDPPWAGGYGDLAAAVADAGADLSPLRGTCCLADRRGAARRPAEVVRASGELRALLEPLRPVAADLDPRFVDGLGVAAAEPAELIALLADGDNGARVIDAVGVDRTLSYLAGCAADEVISARVVPTDRGGLAAIGEAYLTGDGALAELVRDLDGRPPLVDRAVEARHGAALASLGAPRLGLRAVIELVGGGELALDDGELRRLHRAIDAQRDDLSPALAALLARAPIHLSVDGRRRPLAGDGPALLPADDDVRALWPGRPWLDPELAALAYVRSLPVDAIGPAEVVAALCADPFSDHRRPIFAYLAGRASALSGDQVARLVAAPLWPDAGGELRPLAELRLPGRHPAVVALYERWPRAATVEPGDAPGAAMHLARALGVDHRVIEPDLATAIDDIAGAGGDIELDAAVAAVLEAAAGELPRSRLERACDAPIFLCADGERRALGRWSEPRRDRAHRAGGPLRELLARAGYPLLDETAAAAIEGFLGAAGARPATALDLVGVFGDAADLDPAAAAALRAALVASRGELGDAAAAIAAMPLWPTASGLRPAAAVIDGAALAGLPGDWAAALEGVDVIDPGAADDAAALGELIDFADPLAALAGAVAATARLGAPLSEQPELLGSVDRVAPVSAALIDRATLAVDAAGRLVDAELVVAGELDRRFLGRLEIAARLADPAWAAAVEARVGERFERLGLRQVIGALQSAPAEALGDAGAREALYEWIAANRAAIAADDQARGALGRCPVFLSAGGVLRAARDLLFDEALPDLGIDWSPSDEIDDELRGWLRATYRPASRQLRLLVDHLLDAIDDAANDRDLDRIAELLGHLARALGGPAGDDDLDELARRFKLRKRLRVETSDGDVDRPRRLLAPGGAGADLLARFAATLPPRIAPRYRDEAVVALLRAAGADAELGVEVLAGYLAGDNLRPGADAAIALSCYVAAAADRDPALRRALDLERRCWVADGAGALRRGAELYWPGSGARALVGDAPERFVHPELAHRVPAAVSWIGALTADTADLDAVIARLVDCDAAGRAAPAEILGWLDASLEERRIDAAAVRAGIEGLAVLVDDLGALRPPRELVIEGARRLFGDRRGDWSTGARLTRLASALRIARRPGKREVMGFFDDVVDELAGEASEVGELVERLPRCLDVLIEEGGRGPARLPVAVSRGGVASIAVLPEAAGEVEFEDVIRAEGADEEAWRVYLARYGLGVPAAETEAAAETETETEVVSAVADAVADADAVAEETEGIIARLRRWIRGGEEEEERPEPPDEPEEGEQPGRPTPGRSSTPRRPRPPKKPEPADAPPPDHRRWFRPDRQLGPQLSANPRWLADRERASSYGLAHSPARLPLPYLYAPAAIYGDFDARRQTWRRLDAPAAWRSGTGRAGEVAMSGRVPGGEAQVPLPLYGAVVEVRGDARLIEGRGGAVLVGDGDVEVGLDVALAASPRFDRARAASRPELLAPTVDDGELPDEVHDFAASIAAEPDPLAVAELITGFIRDRYAYDPSYIEDPAVAAWLQQRTRRRSNIHVAALHAGGDADHLGRGVCYELNALACELLRRCGVPAAVATGWTFDRGQIDEPDHLWAMALLDCGDGPRWLPVDASTTRDGRPLHANRRPPGPWRAPRGRRGVSKPGWTRRPRARERRHDAVPVGDLVRVARYIESTTDTHLGSREELLAACRAVLTDPERAAAVARLILGRSGR